jgi:hypothetical protein
MPHALYLSSKGFSVFFARPVGSGISGVEIVLRWLGIWRRVEMPRGTN